MRCDRCARDTIHPIESRALDRSRILFLLCCYKRRPRFHVHQWWWWVAMEVPELVKLAFARVQRVEPEHVGKIFGVMLLREPDEDELVQLAYGPEATLLAKIEDTKAALTVIYARCSAAAAHGPPGGGGVGVGGGGGYHQQPQQLFSRPPVPACGGVRHHYSPAAAAAAAFGYQVQSPQYWPDSPPAPPTKAAQQEFAPPGLVVDASAEGPYPLRGGQHVLDDNNFGGGYYYPAGEDAFPNGGGGGGGSPARARRSNGLSTRRPCHYFSKGICKNGQNCHYSHHQVYQDALAGAAINGDVYNHQPGGVTPGSLETLEMEITELLNSRRGQPVSIASLPTLYGEKYGKGLQADGYLTESQRHGKAGYSLTRLLSRLNKIRVIERPHGQHSVVLAEDAAKYMDFRGGGGGGGGDTGSVPASSHQIYLTFPAESTFAEDDVANYFGQYGPVRDVRIPCQERRMFGFVSFQSPETVSTILMRRNPHFICGSRVLVKPYREKSKCVDRTCVDNIKSMVPYCPPRFFEFDQELYTEYDASRLMRKQLAEKREMLLEMERRRATVRRLESMPPQFAYFDCSIEDASPLHSLQDDSKQLDLMNPSLASPDPLEIVSNSQAPPTQAGNIYDDHESNQIELLPESPFAASAPAGNSISTII
ncbi:zinc finger CCCH domain-containing protein 54 isoform X5 [Oryza sativa Japonica Group]|uniref:zinc finger CCCH domain-containing protein 54 isoform X5 n=1 Tax=Oryza sativa subsp. japonica TaxID=39947 RepID=UPI00339BC83B